MAQVCIWIAATAILATGVGLMYSGRSIGDPIAAVGSFMALADMVFFGWLVVRGTRPMSIAVGSVVPAE